MLPLTPNAPRQTVRQHVGDLIRREPRTEAGQGGVLTVTGLLPSPLKEPLAATTPTSKPTVAPASAGPEVDAVVTQLFRHTRSLLTLKGRPPFRLAGIETYERLHRVARFSLDLLAQRYEPRLAQLYQGLQSALSSCAETSQELQQGAAWLHDIAYILEPATTQPMRAEHVAGQLRGYLDTVRWRSDVTPSLKTFGRHLDTVSRSYWPGLFHCYDMPGLPRTNNELESRFRDTRRRLLRTTGQKGQTQRTLQRQGAWELLPRPPTEATVLGALRQTPAEDLAQERQRFAEHRQRFRMQSRSLRQTQAQFDHLRQRWLALYLQAQGDFSGTATNVLRALQQEGIGVTPEIVSRLSPYLTEHIKRFGQYFRIWPLNRNRCSLNRSLSRLHNPAVTGFYTYPDTVGELSGMARTLWFVVTNSNARTRVA